MNRVRHPVRHEPPSATPKPRPRWRQGKKRSGGVSEGRVEGGTRSSQILLPSGQGGGRGRGEVGSTWERFRWADGPDSSPGAEGEEARSGGDKPLQHMLP